MSAALTVAAGTAGIVASYVDASNYIYAYHNGTNATLVKVVGGTPTTLVDEAAAYGAGRILKLIVFGNLVTMFYNDVRIGTTQTIGDAGLQAGTRAGLFTSNVGNSLDNFTVFPFGTSNEHSDLDKYIA